MMRGQEIVYFMTPQPKGRYFWGKCVILMYVCNNLIYSKKLEQIVMMTKVGLSKLYDRRAEILVLERGYLRTNNTRHT